MGCERYRHGPRYSSLAAGTEPNDDYSTSAPGFQRMLERSQSFHKSMSSSSRLLQKSLSFRKSSSRLSVRSLDVSISQRYEDALAASAAAAISPASPASPAQDSFRSLGNSQRSDRPLRRRPAIVQADIHCTRTPQEEQEYDTEEGAVNANASTSHFPYNLHSGRPDLDKIFEEMKEEALSLGERNVAVIRMWSSLALLGSSGRSLSKTLGVDCWVLPERRWCLF